MLRSSLAAVVTAMLASCSGSHDLAPADLAAYRQFTQDLSTQLGAYCSTASTMLSVSDCTAAVQRYLDRARPDVAGMASLAPRMDGYMMAGMGSGYAGDMRCAMDLISREIDRHAGAACASGDMDVNRAEARRHCDQMVPYSEHMQMRGAEAAAMMGSDMMNCCGAQPDGGWMMPDGGMMGWDHRMPGCLADGG